MASIINAATSGGLISTGDTSGQLQLQTAGTTAVTINSSQNVGLGVTPSSWGGGGYSGKALEVGAVGNSLWGVNATNLYSMNNIYYNSGFLYASTNKASYYLQQDGSHFWNSAPSGTAGNAITFTQVLSVNKGTTLVLEGGTSSSGTGIAFPATQSASSNANTLDDYEEGTFTPTIGGGSTFGTTTYQFSPNVSSEYGGTYTKIGNMVYCQITFGISAVSGGSGNVMIAGLPFTSTASPTPYASFMFGTINNLTHNGSRTQFGARTNNNTTTAYMWEFGLASGSTSDTPLSYSALCPSGAATNITCSVVYQTS